MKPETIKNLTAVVEENRKYHFENCRAGARKAPWDYLVLTAATQRQAEGFALELSERKARGFFHENMKVVIAVDVDGKRIGSGGATLNALRAVASLASQTGSGPVSRDRILVIHSGGSSMRIPHLAAIGKIFAAVPAKLPGGATSTVFDELFIAFAPLGMKMSEGMVVLSGDVLLAFPSSELDPNWKGVRGIGFQSEPELGTHHGVFVTDKDGHVNDFLHKAPVDKLVDVAGRSATGKVAVDSGVFMFDRAAIKKLVKLAGVNRYDGCLMQRAVNKDVGIDLYEDFTRAMVGGLKDSPPHSLSETLHKELANIPFTASVFKDFAFVHMGTTKQFMDAWSSRDESANIFASDIRAHYVSDTLDWNGTANHATIEGSGAVARGAVFVYCSMKCEMDIGEGAFLTGLRCTEGAVRVPANVVMCGLPLRSNDDKAKWVVLLYGTKDNPKLTTDAGGTFLGEPLENLPSKLGMSEDALWPDGCAHNLWSAKLYSASNKTDPTTIEFLLNPDPASAGEWRERFKLSMADIFRLADTPAAADFKNQVTGETAAKIYASDALAGADTEPENIFNAHNMPSAAHYFIDSLETIARKSTDLIAARLLAAANVAAAGAAQTPESEIWIYDGREIHRRYREPAAIDTQAATWFDVAAFERVAAVICSHQSKELKPNCAICHNVEITAPARLDFGGGWSDTPPFSLERGGTVLNAAIDLDGGPPVFAAARLIDEPVLRFISRDLERTLEISSGSHLKTYANPADPFSLAKAALALICPELLDATDMREWMSGTGGMEVESRCRIPLGSGLGTSSIVASTLISAVARLRSIKLEPQQLFDLVLAAEQMITTGGGWQDQVGGVVPGIKLTTTKSGIPQVLNIEKVELSETVEGELKERMLLFYTGQTRRTKNLLREIMGNYLRRQTGTLPGLERIKIVAEKMRDALLDGRIDDFGKLMLEHWELNKRMDPNSSTGHIENLFRAGAPFMVGGKLAGAGGGGFMIAISKKASDTKDLALILSEQAGGRGGRPYAWDLSNVGLSVNVKS